MGPTRFGFDPALWPRLSPLLDEAMALPPADRAAWLARLPPAQTDLADALQALLDNDPATGLTMPALDDDEVDTHRAGDPVGPYRLVRPLGQGGMGSVWLALRSDGQLQRPVALKLPHAGSSRPDLAERLARERDLLAALAHPHIARLYDAGVDAQGQPYLALEVVSGLRIDEHCRLHVPDLRARVRLFLQAARAVAHAHAQLVVHRDIKPSNLLVDDQGQVKLLDFGIGKLLDERMPDATPLTREAGRLMTREYASPEQVAGRPVDTRSDQYSLAVLLFELLTGQRPYRPAHDSAGALEDAILRADPLRPSEAVADPRQRRALRGDIDTIVLKALKKDPAERYATVDALADDIQRHLDHRPLLAQPDSLGYMLRKLWARHTTALAAAAVAAVAVVGGAGLTAWQAHQAERERQRASDVKDFVTSLLRDASPYHGGDVGKVTAQQLLQQARDRLAGAAPRAPEVRAELDSLVAEALLSFGDLDGAEALVLPAVQRARAALGDGHRETVRARLVQAQVLRLRGRSQDLQADLDTLLPLLRQRGSADPEALALGLTNVALLAVDRGAYADAQRAAEEAHQVVRDHLPPQHPEQVATASLLALAYRFNGRIAEARDASARTLALIDQVLGTRPHPRRVEARATYGRALADLGDLSGGAAQLESAIAEARGLFGDDHLTVGVLRQNVVGYLLDLGELARADLHSAEALRVVSRHAQPQSMTHAGTAMARGAVLIARLQPQQALDLLAPASQTLAQVAGAQHELTLGATGYRGLAQVALGQAAEAAQAVAPALAAASAASPQVRLRLAQAAALAQAGQGDRAGAAQALAAAVAAPAPTPKARRERMRALVDLGWLHWPAADPAAARGAWTEALAEAAQLQATSTPVQARALYGLALADLQAGQAAQALAQLQQAHDVLARVGEGSALQREVSQALERARAAAR